ncbi:hypothetical protein [Snodgrassella communis]|uniref:hypothetical protein n=1 Tax=Snodgrassella communis TaxID=2946699 RepID=UPI0035304151
MVVSNRKPMHSLGYVYINNSMNPSNNMFSLIKLKKIINLQVIIEIYSQLKLMKFIK